MATEKGEEDNKYETPSDSPPGPDTVPFSPPHIIKLVVGHLPDPAGDDVKPDESEIPLSKADETNAPTDSTELNVGSEKTDAEKNMDMVAVEANDEKNGTDPSSEDVKDAKEVKTYSSSRTVEVSPAFTIGQVLDRIQSSLPEWPSFVKALKAQRLISGRHSWRENASISAVCAEVGCRTVFRYGMLQIHISSGSFEVGEGDPGKLPLNEPVSQKPEAQSHMSKELKVVLKGLPKSNQERYLQRLGFKPDPEESEESSDGSEEEDDDDEDDDE